jgi:hypothetical protein
MCLLLYQKNISYVSRNIFHKNLTLCYALNLRRVKNVGFAIVKEVNSLFKTGSVHEKQMFLMRKKEIQSAIILLLCTPAWSGLTCCFSSPGDPLLPDLFAFVQLQQ